MSCHGISDALCNDCSSHVFCQLGSNSWTSSRYAIKQHRAKEKGRLIHPYRRTEETQRRAEYERSPRPSLLLWQEMQGEAASVPERQVRTCSGSPGLLTGLLRLGPIAIDKERICGVVLTSVYKCGSPSARREPKAVPTVLRA